MYSKEELSAIIEEYIHALPFPEEPDTLYEPIVYSLGKGGKRLRPLLLSGRLPVVGSVGRYPADYLIGRDPIPYR